MVACAVTAASLAAELWRDGLRWPWGLFTRLLPMLLALAVASGLWVARRELLGRTLELIPQVGRRAWKDFRRITVDQLSEMIWLRLRSVVSLTTSIFMKRIRALGYKQLYQDEKYERRRVSNLVYHLQSSEPFATILAGHVAPPSPALRRVADAAASMPTALWFRPETPWQLPCLGRRRPGDPLLQPDEAGGPAARRRSSPVSPGGPRPLGSPARRLAGVPGGAVRSVEGPGLGALSEPP